jgi:E3 ubiquitin-protein ligase DOA10
MPRFRQVASRLGCGNGMMGSVMRSVFYLLNKATGELHCKICSTNPSAAIKLFTISALHPVIAVFTVIGCVFYFYFSIFGGNSQFYH